MSFSEFLIANGDENLKKYLDSVDKIEPIPDAFFNPLYEKLKMYFVTGGIPESVSHWVENRDVSVVQTVLSEILRAYERDLRNMRRRLTSKKSISFGNRFRHSSRGRIKNLFTT
jgi:predicted AAA+ superfamily ATPase